MEISQANLDMDPFILRGPVVMTSAEQIPQEVVTDNGEPKCKDLWPYGQQIDA